MFMFHNTKRGDFIALELSKGYPSFSVSHNEYTNISQKLKLPIKVAF